MIYVLLWQSLSLSPSVRHAVLQYLSRTTHRVLKSGLEWEVLLNMDPRSFQSHMRLTREQFNHFVDQLKRSGLSDDQQPGGFSQPPVVQKALVFLWYMGNQNSFREISDKFNVSRGSAHNIVLEVLEVTCSLAHMYITLPTDCDKGVISAVFYRLCGIRAIIGAIDGCHIKIQRPAIRGGDYLNRKGFYSLLLQGTVDDQGRFLDIFTGVPGKVHDSRMLRMLCSHFLKTGSRRWVQVTS